MCRRLRAAVAAQSRALRLGRDGAAMRHAAARAAAWGGAEELVLEGKPRPGDVFDLVNAAAT
ncbi:hypothetical protein MNEG_15321, partial [Monoraphidium neglectum]